MYEIAAMMKEMRAECPEWTRDRCRTRAASKPAARKTVPATKKAAAPVVKKADAAVARKKPVKASEITAMYRDLLRKTEVDISRNKQHFNQLESDIRTLQRVGAPEHSTLMMQKKKDREVVRWKIEKLQGIRDDCKKQLGMK